MLTLSSRLAWGRGRVSADNRLGYSLDRAGLSAWADIQTIRLEPRKQVREERALHHPVPDRRYRKARLASSFGIPASGLGLAGTVVVPQPPRSLRALRLNGLSHSCHSGAPSFCLAISYAAAGSPPCRRGRRPQKRQDGSDFALTHILRLRSANHRTPLSSRPCLPRGGAAKGRGPAPRIRFIKQTIRHPSVSADFPVAGCQHCSGDFRRDERPSCSACPCHASLPPCRGEHCMVVFGWSFAALGRARPRGSSFRGHCSLNTAR